jgi:prepilin-type N-terminal cleavage/methylation domain-containing protein
MIARLRGRLAETGGYSLSEMIVVLAILGVVLGALVPLFVSGSHAQVDMSNRFRAQQNGRLALDKLRREIHCTSAAVKGTDGTALAAGTAYSSVQFTLPSYCPTNPTVTSPTPETRYATWCTAFVSTGRYQLWRYVTTSTTAAIVPTCGANVSGTTKVQWADYLAQANAFPAYVAPQGGSSWAPNTAYTVGQLVRPTDTGTNPYLFSVTTAGTSGGSEPTWPTAPNATVTAGATFKNMGALTFGLGQLSVDLPVDLSPSDAMQRYELKDDIVLRNTTR